MEPSVTSGAAYEPAPEFTIASLETLKVFSDPLRQQIIEVLLDGPQTVKQIAGRLGLAPTKLYYHINLLEEHGLIVITQTRVVSGIIEKHYGAVARRFTIARALLTPGSEGDAEGLRTALEAVMDPVRDEILRSVADGSIDTSEDAPPHRKVRFWRAVSRLDTAQAEAFYARLEALIDEFNALEETVDTPDNHPYTLIIGVYPAPKPTPSDQKQS